VDFADAPVARTREAAQKGTLSVMVGSTEPAFRRIRPLLAHMPRPRSSAPRPATARSTFRCS
jgi:3-hydroxyisobutyrate dehydrogenase-like beta-hydroxyacid dehydrogenase